MSEIGCILMASGLSARYGSDKLLEDLNGRPVILRTADALRAAGLAPVAVTRSPAVAELLEAAGIRHVLHDGPRKSDTIHVGLRALSADVRGVLFMPADQPLALPSTLKKLLAQFEADPTRAVRLGFQDAVGSPVLFPAALRAALLAYTGDRGGIEVLRAQKAPCDVVRAEYPWELWDVDTPEMMARARGVIETSSICTTNHAASSAQ